MEFGVWGLGFRVEGVQAGGKTSRSSGKAERNEMSAPAGIGFKVQGLVPQASGRLSTTA